MTARKAAANGDKSTKPRGKPRGKPWPPGVSGNPAGAPRRGESWSEIIKRVGEMTPSEAAEQSLELAKKFLSIGDGVTLKQAVVMRVYASLLFEPQPGLFNAFMERTEGKVTQPVTIEASQILVDKLAELGLTLDDVRSDPAASALFAAAGVSVAVGADPTGTIGGGEAESTK